MHETGHSGLVHWDDLEGWDGEEGGRGVQDGEHMYTHGGFMSNRWGNNGNSDRFFFGGALQKHCKW